jgi:hypothetical protein
LESQWNLHNSQQQNNKNNTKNRTQKKQENNNNLVFASLKNMMPQSAGMPFFDNFISFYFINN